MQRLLPALCLLLSVAEATADERGQASAGNAGVRLSWTRAAEASSCPGAREVELDVERRLGLSPFSAHGAVSIEVLVSRTEHGWTAAIEQRSKNGASIGSRTVTSSAESCQSLAAAAGLAIALMVRASLPEGAQPAQQSHPASSASHPARTDPQAPAASAPFRAPERTNRRGDLALAFAASSGVLPQPSFGATLLGGVSFTERLALGASLTFLPERRFSTPEGSFAFGATLGALGLCYTWLRWSSVAVAACGSGVLGELQVIVASPDPVAPGARLWAGAAAGPRLRLSALAPLHILLSVEALVPFRRRTFAIERRQNTPVVFTQPSVGALGLIGAGLEF